MTLNDAALTTGATAIAAEVTHLQLHNGDPGANNTGNVIGTRSAVTRTVDSDGDITWTAAFTGLPSNSPVTHITYWVGATNGSTRGVTTTRASAGDVAAAVHDIVVTAMDTAEECPIIYPTNYRNIVLICSWKNKFNAFISLILHVPI